MQGGVTPGGGRLGPGVTFVQEHSFGRKGAIHSVWGLHVPKKPRCIQSWPLLCSATLGRHADPSESHVPPTQRGGDEAGQQLPGSNELPGGGAELERAQGGHTYGKGRAGALGVPG